MAEGEPPYWSEKRTKTFTLVVSQGVSMKNAEIFTPQFQNFVGRATNIDPARRPSADDLLQHPLIASLPQQAALASAPLVKRVQAAIAEARAKKAAQKGK